jgi:hypothetical protein
MSATAKNPMPTAGELENAADQTIAACGDDARETVKALIVATEFLEAHVEEPRAAVSTGYSRGRFDLSRAPKDD